MSVGMEAPQFEGLQDYKGKTLIMFFYPLDSCVLAADELLKIEEHREELNKMNCDVIAISQCSNESHQNFLAMKPSKGGVQGINFTLWTDTSGDIAEQYGIKANGYNFRGYCIIDQEGILRAKVIGDLPLGIGITDMVNKVKKIHESNKIKQEKVEKTSKEGSSQDSKQDQVEKSSKEGSSQDSKQDQVVKSSKEGISQDSKQDQVVKSSKEGISQDSKQDQVVKSSKEGSSQDSKQSQEEKTLEGKSNQVPKQEKVEK